MTLVDSNILLDIWSDDPTWGEWSTSALAAAADRGQVVVNPVVLAEVAHRFRTEDELVRELGRTGIRLVPLPVAAAWPAAEAFAAYRQRGGPRTTPLPDFLIGAHALIEKWPVLTRDPKRFRTAFPKVKLIAPK